MTASELVLLLGCSDDAIGSMACTLDPKGISLVVASSVAELVRRTAVERPAMIVLGVRSGSTADLEVIDVVHAVRDRIPVVVVADEDSLDLERMAREKNIFYYLVEPIQPGEFAAVLEDSLRYRKAD